jgi:hypothetical protein
MSSYNRKDLILPLEHTQLYINKICDKLKIFCDKLVPEYTIVESSCLISYPGCYPQIWHADTHYNNKSDANLITFGIALDDISYDMGPLEVYLKSNSIYEINNGLLYSKYNIRLKELEGEIEDGIKYQTDESLCEALKFEKVSCVSNKGDLIIWSSKVYHRGGKNTFKKRPIFYFTLMGKGKPPKGATYSLLKKDKFKNNINNINNINLEWYLTNSNKNKVPIVIYEDILPLNLLNKTIQTIQNDINKSKNNNIYLSRDNTLATNERWININSKPNDIFEECVLNIAYHDLSNTLPSNISKSVVGVSWRLILNTNNIYHYDSDEYCDYVIDGTPIITPLLSSVTYLVDNGDPTIIFERSRINYTVPNMYISMPKKNKHVAFDPRLLHGTTNELSNINTRILIGINYWEKQTQESIKNGSKKLIPNNLILPLNKNMNYDIMKNKNKNNVINKQPIYLKIENIETKKTTIKTYNYGYDLFNNYLPINIFANIPTTNFLKNIQNKHIGDTLSIKLLPEDFIIKILPDYKNNFYKQKNNKKLIPFVNSIIKNRCNLFKHNNLSMNPQSVNVIEMCNNANN